MPDTSAIYGSLGAGVLATGTPEQQRTGLGLLLTSGVSNQYRKGEITREQAIAKIQTITQAGQIPDAIALKAVNDAITGEPALEQSNSGNELEQGFKAFGIVANPFFATSAGSLTVSIVSEYGAPFVKYINQPDNILSGQFIPQRPDAVILAGQVALSQLNRIMQQQNDLAQIYKDIIPETASRLKIGDADPVQGLAAAVAGDLAEPIRNLLQAQGDDIQDALGKLQDGIYRRIDGLDTTTKQIVTLLTQEQDARKRKEGIEQQRQRQQYVQQEISGAITLVDAFTRFIVGDADTAKKITGCLNAANTVSQLFSSFAAGSLGPLGLAGGVVNVLTGVFGLFTGGPDPVAQRLDAIDKKLDQIREILIEGFQHIDHRLTDILDVAQKTLREVIDLRQALQPQIDDLKRRIDYLTTITASIGRDAVETPISLLAQEMRDNVADGVVLSASVGSTLVTHARSLSRNAVMNGKLSSFTSDTLSILLEQSGDTRQCLGNLPAVIQLVPGGAVLRDNNPPDVKHWSHVIQGLLEFILLLPEQTPNSIRNNLKLLWDDGNNLKSSVLTATNPDLLLSLLDDYEAKTLRERSCASIAVTLDEQLATVLALPISAGISSLGQFIREKVAQISLSTFFDTAINFRFLLSVLTWRCSAVGDEASVNPRALDFIADRESLAAYLTQTLAHEGLPNGSAPTGNYTEPQGVQVFLRGAVRDAMLQSFRRKIGVDIDRLRSGIPVTASSPRVRDVDEALLGMNAIARSRGIIFPDQPVPPFRVAERSSPTSIYEVSKNKLVQDLKALCQAALQDFANVRGDIVDPTIGLRKLTSAPIGLSGNVLSTDSPINADGKKSYARIFLPKPLNLVQAREQLSQYEAILLDAFVGIQRLNLTLRPASVRQIDVTTTIQQEFRYYSRSLNPGEAPSELALILRESKGIDGTTAQGQTQFAIELWVFTRKSGLINRDL